VEGVRYGGALLTFCTKLLYALRVLRAHGLSQQCFNCLKNVFRATVESIAPVRGPCMVSGCCTAGDRDRLNAFLYISIALSETLLKYS